MKKLARSGLVALVAIGLLSCESRTDRRDTGGVLLVVSTFNGLPTSVSMNTTGNQVQAGSITIRSVLENPNSEQSDLMDVRLTTYEVTYTRLDAGKRVPPPLVSSMLGLVAHGSTTTLNNLPLLASQQLFNPPLSDLLFINGGRDKETGSTTITLGLSIRFFGKTLSGDAVSTDPVGLSIDFTQ
ncbi:MAG TPA: hypothetical protein VGV61_17680 [Thermoanaerobaculia bacterium]|nr:hypothetical protein [Thermoanaerobaculia bacterium]